VEAASFYQSVLTREFFAHLPMLYDLVLIDCPPLLQVAYASTLAAYAEAAVVLVEHDSPMKQLAAVADRLDLVGTPTLGYIYTRAPLRREMTSGIGSMANKLGTPQVVPAPSVWARLRSVGRG
jgi:Mrp family chromosome partitioning ATPase